MYRNKDDAGVLPQRKKQKQQNGDFSFFKKINGHRKKDCTKYHIWNTKKDTLITLMS